MAEKISIAEFKKLTLLKLKKPAERNLNEDLQWFSQSIGLFSERDKEKSCFRIFIELLKATKTSRFLSSDEIAFKSNLSRGTVIHHMNKLIATGIVINHRNRYALSVDNLESLVDEMKKSMIHTFENLSIIAEELDEELGLFKRRAIKSKVISD